MFKRSVLSEMRAVGVAPRCGARLPGAPITTHSACQRAGRVTVGYALDHIVPHEGNRALLFDRLNVQYLCRTCHSVKTAKEDGGFGK